MANSNTEHSRKLRQKTSKAANQKLIDAGGIRFGVLLEAPYAQQFEALAAEHGSKKKALIFLLDQHAKNA